MDLWIARIPPTDDARALTECRALLPSAEIAASQAFHRPDDQRRHITSRGVLRAVLSRYCPVDPSDWRFARAPEGRLDIESPTPTSIRFSLSHTHGLVALAVSRVGDIGVDAEEIRPIPDLLELADRSLTASEFSEVRELDGADQATRFLTFWTLKEAYLKALGCGLSVDPRSVEIEIDKVTPATTTASPAIGPESQYWWLATLLMEGHVVSVAAPQVTGRCVVATLLDAPGRTVAAGTARLLHTARVRSTASPRHARGAG